MLTTTSELSCEVVSDRYPTGRRGTYSGWVRHKYLGETPCDECADANRARTREYMRQRTGYYERVSRLPAADEERLVCALPTVVYPDGVTGTPAGARRHYKAHERPCAACAAAHRSARKAVVDAEGLAVCARGTRNYPQGRTGTSAGAKAHRRAGETPCDDCAAAEAGATGERRERTGFGGDYQRAVNLRADMLADALANAGHKPKGEWWLRAACRGAPPGPWFAGSFARAIPAYLTCGDCAVRLDCAIAHAGEEQGVWGGISARERPELRAAIKAAGGTYVRWRYGVNDFIRSHEVSAGD